MSVISNRHAIVAFDSKTSKAQEGQRLAKIGYKESKSGRTSVCCSIPFVETSEVVANLTQFLPHVQELVQATQDKIIRAAHEAGKTEVSDAELSIAEVLSFLDSESQGDRLSKEVIGQWFDGNLADILTLAFAEKLGISDNATQEDDKKISLIVGSYKEKLASLSGSKTLYTPEVCQNLTKALMLADDDVMVMRLQKRIDKMLETPKTVDMMAL